MMYAVLDWSASLAVVSGKRRSLPIPRQTGTRVAESGSLENRFPNSAENTSDKDTKELFESESNRLFAALSRVALRKLIQMNQVRTLSDLAVPHGNHLEALRGNLLGFHSIQINDQWRIVFRWTNSGPEQVAIADYH